MIGNLFRGALLVGSLVALTLAMSTYLDNHDHPWLNERVTLLFGDCPHTYVQTDEYDMQGKLVKETCEAPRAATRWSGIPEVTQPEGVTP
jgi:hypothetical protein